jgi:hypothetical protein
MDIIKSRRETRIADPSLVVDSLHYRENLPLTIDF